ncbi:MAG: TonB-dependent receptor [Acidobacteria bacterium]|nr:TonB-dependent receptor [Acidobacteriota bacterium]
MFAEKMMKKGSFLMGVQVTFVLILLALFCSTAAAQTTAAIVGLVTDPSGAAVPGAKVTITHPATGLERTFETDDTGNYLFTLLPIGDYSVRVQKAGFKTVDLPKATLAAGDRLKLDVSLEVGAVQETVSVTAQAPALQTQSATVGSLVDNRATENLPLNGRNYVTLALLVPGGRPTTTGFGGGRMEDPRTNSNVGVISLYATNNNFLLDGMDNNEQALGTTVVKPSLDAIAEMRVDTNVYSAERGRTAGAVIEVVTKSGTNEFHGSLFEFWRNEKLDAANFFAAPGSRPAYKQNQFGGSLGGPIKKDRTFFFADYEGYYRRLGQVFTSSVPTLKMRDGDFSEILPTRIFNQNTGTPYPGNIIPPSDWDTVGHNVLNLYPEPQTSGLFNNFKSSPAKGIDQTTFDVKIDHRISDRDSIYGRYSFTDTYDSSPPAYSPGSGYSSTSNYTSGLRTQGAQVTYIHTFNPGLLMRLRAGYSRFSRHALHTNAGKNLADQIGLTGVNLDFDSSGLPLFFPIGYSMMGDSSYLPSILVNNMYQTNADITYKKGSHSIEAGMEYRRRQVASDTSPEPRSDFFFLAFQSGHAFTEGDAFASLLLGTPLGFGGRNRTLLTSGFRYAEWGAFLQDDWRATPWLTFNLGVRYDYYSPVTEAFDRMSTFDLTRGEIVIAGQNGISETAGVQKDWNNFAPRFGFPATLSRRTVLRGGYGISYLAQTTTPGGNPPFSSLWVPPFGFKMSQGLPAELTATDYINPSGGLGAVTFDHP